MARNGRRYLLTSSALSLNSPTSRPLSLRTTILTGPMWRVSYRRPIAPTLPAAPFADGKGIVHMRGLATMLHVLGDQWAAYRCPLRDCPYGGGSEIAYLSLRGTLTLHTRDMRKAALRYFLGYDSH